MLTSIIQQPSVDCGNLPDVFVINVSSPNTPNLRDLQGVEQLRIIIEACQKMNQQKSAEFITSPKPLLVKVQTRYVPRTVRRYCHTSLSSVGAQALLLQIPLSLVLVSCQATKTCKNPVG